MITRPRRGAGAAVLAAVTAAGLASCGSAHAGQATPSAPPVRLSLATSAGYPDGSWAVIVMGGSAAQHNDFWQVFVRPGQAGAWKLATPLGAASNGGITVAAEGGPALAAAIRPSQDLSFSPVASSSDNGAKWAQAGLLDAPLAGYPDALAAAPDGGLIALTRTGDVELRPHSGAAWTRLASEHTVAAAAGQRLPPGPVHLRRLQPVGRCAGGGGVHPGRAGRNLPAGRRPLVPDRARAARRAGPAGRRGPPDGPGGPHRGGAAGRGPRAGRAAGRRVVQPGRHLMAPVAALPGQPGPAALSGLRRRLVRDRPSGGGSLGVLLPGGRAVSVSGPGAAWRSLPALPAGASRVPDGGATLAAVPGGFEALTARGSQLSVWALSSGSSGWGRSQVINVAIPYGSSS